MNKVIIAFCEGDHDINFLGKLLIIHGYSPYKNKVKDFPKPLSKLYIKLLSNSIAEDRRFEYQERNKKLPFSVFSKEDVLVIFHNLGGDGNILNGSTKPIIEMYIDLNDEAIRNVDEYDKINFRFLYFLDADDIGVRERLNEVKNLLELDNIQHHQLQQESLFDLGCYIFHDESNDAKNGKLEDLLLELMKQNNEDIFNQCNGFIENNMLDPKRQRRYVCKYGEDDKYISSSKFKKEKSIISIAGQLQFSGSSNSVIIANSDYIQTEDIKNNDCCNNIMMLF